MLQLCACAPQAARILSPEVLMGIILNILYLNLKDSRTQSFYLRPFTVLPPSRRMIKERESLRSSRPASTMGGEKMHNAAQQFICREKTALFLIDKERATQPCNDRGLPFNPIKKTQFTCKMLATFKYVSLINYHLLHKTVIVPSLKPHLLISFCPVHQKKKKKNNISV